MVVLQGRASYVVVNEVCIVEAIHGDMYVVVDVLGVG